MKYKGLLKGIVLVVVGFFIGFCFAQRPNKQYHSDFMVAYGQLKQEWDSAYFVAGVNIAVWEKQGLESTHQQMVSGKPKIFDALARSEAVIDPLMEKIKNPPLAYQRGYDSLVKMDVEFKKMKSLALEPNGTLDQYSNEYSACGKRFAELEKRVAGVYLAP